MIYETKWLGVSLCSDGEGKTPEKLYTPKEVSAILNVHDTTVKRWIKSGAIEAIALPSTGGKHHFHRIKGSVIDKIWGDKTWE